MVGILLCCKAWIRKVFFTVWAVEIRLASQEAYILWKMAQFQKVNIDESRGQGQRSNTDQGVLTEGQAQYRRPPCAFDIVNIVFFVAKQGNVMSKSTVRSLPWTVCRMYESSVILNDMGPCQLCFSVTSTIASPIWSLPTMLLSAAIIGASERYSLLDIVLHSFAFSFIDRLRK